MNRFRKQRLKLIFRRASKKKERVIKITSSSTHLLIQKVARIDDFDVFFFENASAVRALSGKSGKHGIKKISAQLT